jgi:hypothetical protein
LANAPGLRESQLRGIVRSGLPSHANLLLSCASCAAIEGGRSANAGWPAKAEDWHAEAILGVPFLGNERRELKTMITATWTWTDIRNFEENPSGYQRAQLAWMLALAAALFLVTVLFG